MTKAEVIRELERLRWGLKYVKNRAEAADILCEQGKLWLGSSIYGIDGVVAGLKRESDAETICQQVGNSKED